MKASCEFVLLSVLFAFSWGKDIHKTRLQLGIPKQSVRIESIDVPPAEPPALQVKMVIEPGDFSVQWPIQGGSARKGYFFPLSGILKGRGFTSWGIWKVSEICLFSFFIVPKGLTGREHLKCRVILSRILYTYTLHAIKWWKQWWINDISGYVQRIALCVDTICYPVRMWTTIWQVTLHFRDRRGAASLPVTTEIAPM